MGEWEGPDPARCTLARALGALVVALTLALGLGVGELWRWGLPAALGPERLFLCDLMALCALAGWLEAGGLERGGLDRTRRWLGIAALLPAGAFAASLHAHAAATIFSGGSPRAALETFAVRVSLLGEDWASELGLGLRWTLAPLVVFALRAARCHGSIQALGALTGAFGGVIASNATLCAALPNAPPSDRLQAETLLAPFGPHFVRLLPWLLLPLCLALGDSVRALLAGRPTPPPVELARRPTLLARVREAIRALAPSRDVRRAIGAGLAIGLCGWAGLYAALGPAATEPRASHAPEPAAFGAPAWRGHPLDEALREAEQRSQHDPGRALVELTRLLGDVDGFRGSPDQVRARRDRAVWGICHLLNRFGRHAEALALIERVHAHHPDPELARLHFVVRDWSGDTGGALDEATALGEVLPEDASLPLWRANARLRLGEPLRAADEYGLAIAQHPEWNELYLLRSQARRKAGDLAGAERDSDEAIARGCGALAHQERALVRAARGDLAGAARDRARGSRTVSGPVYAPLWP